MDDVIVEMDDIIVEHLKLETRVGSLIFIFYWHSIHVTIYGSNGEWTKRENYSVVSSLQ